MVLNPGAVLGNRYEIIEKIGSGGMAVVYRGKDKKLDRYVTVKVLRDEYVTDDEFIERFQSEARSAARLSHPNIVRVYDVGQDDDIHYIVMEYIHGDTLKKAIKEKAPFDTRSTINVSLQIASALSRAHKSHIIHRDIKPQNILVGTDGVVKVTDFGIARAATASTMTTTANAAGSVHYFSPEQARGGYVDEKSDIYSLGITMFEMITGMLPFQGSNSVSIALKHIGEGLPDIRQYNPNCNPSLEGIIKKATTKKADERYANIDLLLADLLRARMDTAEIGGDMATEPAKPSEVAAAVASVTTMPQTSNSRVSRRAEVAAELRAAQEKRGRAVEIPETPIPEMDEPATEATRQADAQEIEFIRLNKRTDGDEDVAVREPENVGAEEDDYPAIHEPLVSFEKYGKKLFQTSDEDYEEEYMEAKPVRISKRPDRQRRNPRKEADYGNPADRKTEKKVMWGAIVTSLVIIAIITVVHLRLSGGAGGFQVDEQDITMPNLIGITLEEAQKTAADLGITLVDEGEDYSSYFEKGTVIYQSVGEDTNISAGSKVGIKISLGLTSETMPDVVGKTESEASEKITSLVGATPDIMYHYDDEVELGNVVSQKPDKGEKINAKTAISLVISKGEEGKDVLVPNVVGSTEADAKSALTAIGLSVGTVSKAESATIDAGKVMTQTLSAGQEVPQGSVVNLVVSTGKPEVIEPEVPEENIPAEDPEPTPPAEATSGTKSFSIQVPSGASGDLYVRVVKNDADGLFPVVDEYRNSSAFPYSVSITGRGSGTVSCYIDDVLQWTQNINFSE